MRLNIQINSSNFCNIDRDSLINRKDIFSFSIFNSFLLFLKRENEKIIRNLNEFFGTLNRQTRQYLKLIIFFLFYT